MHTLDFWFDPISPYAYLAFEQLPKSLEGLSVEVRYRPVLFAGLLAHWGHKGPAEVEPKRAWTYRHVLWLAHRHGIEMQLPAAHPFNPLPLLRLAWACAPTGLTPSRRVCERVFHHVWRSGLDAADGERLDALHRALAPRRDPGDADVKQMLREATDDAIARGVFGVPTFDAVGRVFWGVDSLDMLAAALRGEPWFDSPTWSSAAARPLGASRRTG
jgi:2-hydroxychromene-2-carboxylate isomerase